MHKSIGSVPGFGVNRFPAPFGIRSSSYRQQRASQLFICCSSLLSRGGPTNPPKPPAPEGGDGHGNGGPKEIDPPEAALKAGHEDIHHVIILDVSGMHCGGCVSKVKRVLELHDSVTQANVNPATEVALVKVKVPALSSADSKQRRESVSIETIVSELVQILKQNGFDGKVRDSDQKNSAVADVVRARQEERARRLREAGWQVAVAWGLASVCILGHLPHFWHGAPRILHRLASSQLHAVLSALAMLGPGRQLLSRGYASMMHRRPDMNSLVALGASASFAVSLVASAVPSLGWPTFFEEPAMLLGCVLLGRALEERAKLAASSDLAALQHLIPERARLEINASGLWKDVPTEALTPEDILTVLPGDRIPVDGTVTTGTSSVNESALTGEALPVLKSAGASVTAGTLNIDGKLRVKVKKAGSATTMADILRLVETAQARTAPVQRLADSVAGKFAVGVMAASTATLAFWLTAGPLLFPKAVAAYCGARSSGGAGTLLLGLQMACNVLTIACPCALGLAAPTAVLVGTSAAARRGLLIRGGDVLEKASHVDTIVFDKTGTLTVGKPELQGIAPTSSHFSQSRLLQLAAALELESSHPLAQSVLRASSIQGIAQLKAQEGSCRHVPGNGITGTVDGHLVSIGTREFAESTPEKAPPSEDPGSSVRSDRTAEASSTPTDHIQMFLSVDGKLAGIFTLADQLRADSAQAISRLRKQGYNIHLLSGDAEGVAQKVAAQVGIQSQHVHAAVKPSGKAALIQSLQEQGRKVAMVGDGINDAGALSMADVGVAMGGGVDVASEVADVVLLGDRLPQVVEALEISSRTFSKIQQNLCWAFGYNLIGLPIAAGALLPKFGMALTPSLSGALMGISSLAVMANSLTLHLNRGLDLEESNGRKTPSRPRLADQKLIASELHFDKPFRIQQRAGKPIV